MAKDGDSKDNSMGITGVILGITSIVFSGVSGIILGIVGLIFALKQKKYSPNKWSKAGVVLNIIGIIVSIIVFILVYYSMAYNPAIQAQIQQQLGAMSSVSG
ncbi:MAG: hypothetical protein AABX11_04600 [Nanoarchaeota archaeon]